ncbi:unnamed protein product [Protopolystoma xenopodis]|uniref:Uncharacterized protein n=1 Tax=Protopolystoma xenopodis TaxID=117903 RepID=A0A448X7L3_9PLAT|nr:unnamed protein product [Protopolystoma xenopodis]
MVSNGAPMGSSERGCIENAHHYPTRLVDCGTDSRRPNVSTSCPAPSVSAALLSSSRLSLSLLHTPQQHTSGQAEATVRHVVAWTGLPEPVAVASARNRLS